MGTSNPHLVPNPLWPGAADPGRIPKAGGVLIAARLLLSSDTRDLSPWAYTNSTPKGGINLSNPLIVGVDVHRKSNAFSLMDNKGQEVADRFSSDNNRPGTQGFVKQVAQRVTSGDFDAIHIAAEATGWYWWHFFQTPS